MNESVPPPLTPATEPARSKLGRGIIIAAIVGGATVFLLICTLAILHVTGYVGFYKLSNPSMLPAIDGDDGVCTERLTYLLRPPKRGEVITFKADWVPHTRPGQQYAKRLVGLPGDRLRISDGTLYINDQPSPLRNKAGEIHYSSDMGTYLHRDDDSFTVPAGCYFVLGDNSAKSADSRFFGPVPASALVGRILFCYSPAKNAGLIR